MTTIDPIFDVIERHRTAIKAWSDALTIADCLEPHPDAQARADATDDSEATMAAELVATQPTTLAGALAAIRYVVGYYNGESDVFPGEHHDLLSQGDFLSFVDGIGDAIEAAI